MMIFDHFRKWQAGEQYAGNTESIRYGGEMTLFDNRYLILTDKKTIIN